MKNNRIRLSLKLHMSLPVRSPSLSGAAPLLILVIASFAGIALAVLQHLLNSAP